MNLNPISVEVSIALLFTAFIIYLTKKDKKNLKLVFYLVIYAFIFENIHIILSKGMTGGYFYNSGFILIGLVPLFIILSWTMIIYSSMTITNSFSFNESSKPFVDALLTVLIDLFIDIPSVRLGFWVWNGYSINDGWFGVSANNFIGWVLVALSFCYLWRKYSKRIGPLVIPLAYFLCFIVGLLIIQPIEVFLNLSKNQELLIFAGLILALLAIIKIKNKKIKRIKNIPSIVYLIRLPFFAFGILSLLILGIYKESFILSISYVILTLIELGILFVFHPITSERTS